MKKYRIEQRIRTLLDNAVEIKDEKAFFDLDGIHFEHEDFNYRDGGKGDFWIASSEVEAETWLLAANFFLRKLFRIIPRISLIGQAYISIWAQSLFITRTDKEFSRVGLFHLFTDRTPTGLTFMTQEKEALELSLTRNDISDEFFLYWNDATNTPGFSSKLLLIFAALEALARNRDKRIFASPMDLFNNVLGEKLAKECFAQTTGLRNRLSHGEYFSDTTDVGRNYVEEIHKNVVHYFNSKIFQRSVISEDVVHPQRNPYDNREGWPEPRFIKSLNNEKEPLSLRNVLKDDMNKLKSGKGLIYQIIRGNEEDELNKQF